jgi:hypothetical protein
MPIEIVHHKVSRDKLLSQRTIVVTGALNDAQAGHFAKLRFDALDECRPPVKVLSRCDDSSISCHEIRDAIGIGGCGSGCGGVGRG